MVKLEFESLDDLVRHLARAEIAEAETREIGYRLEDEKARNSTLHQRIRDLEIEAKAMQLSHASSIEHARPEPTLFARKESVKGLIQAVQGNQKIGAIKEARLLTGLGLKEAKDLVEEVWVFRKEP